MADRLYRSRDDRMLAGVAAGVADALDADPSLIRIAWALLAIFTGGIAFVVYIVMAIIVPEAPARWDTMPPGGPVGSGAGQAPGGQAVGRTPGEPAAGFAPETGAAPIAPPDVPPATPPGTPVDSGWAGPAPAAASPPTYWTSEPDAHRGARRARRDARDPARGGLIAGIVLIVLGGVFLIREFVPWFDWHLWWPVALIALGGLLLVLAIMPSRSSDN